MHGFDSSLLPYTLAAIIGLSVVAMIFACFSYTWKGISVAYLFLGLVGAVIIVTLLNFSAVTHNKGLETANNKAVISWAKTEYGVALTDNQARTLIGTSEQGNIVADAKFGTADKVKTPAYDQTEASEQNITLIYVKGHWKIALITGKAGWSELHHLK